MSYDYRYCIFPKDSNHVHYTNDFRHMLTALDQGHGVVQGHEEWSLSGNFTYFAFDQQLTRIATR